MYCEICGGTLCWLGRLGRLCWFVCRDCGMQCSRSAEEVDDCDCE